MQQLTPEHNDEILNLLEEIDTEAADLTDWELEFVSDLIDRRVRTFTPKQAGLIRRIHRERMP